MTKHEQKTAKVQKNLKKTNKQKQQKLSAEI